MLIILYHYLSSRIVGKRVRLRARECIIYANTTGFNRFLGRARHEDIINNNNRFLLIHRVSECRRHCHSYSTPPKTATSVVRHVFYIYLHLHLCGTSHRQASNEKNKIKPIFIRYF